MWKHHQFRSWYGNPHEKTLGIFMNTHSHSQQSDEFLPHDDFDDDDNDLAVEPPMRVTLQAGIAWVATRDAAFTSAFEATTYNRKMYQLILEAGLSANTAVVPECWTPIRDAITAGRITAWGQKFELPANFELGDPWPRGPRERLSPLELSEVHLIDVGGIAAYAGGIVSEGQTWYCRILVEKDQLQSEFPASYVRQAGAKSAVGAPRDHKFRFARSVLQDAYRTAESRLAVTQGMMENTVAAAAKAKGRSEISHKTVVRAIKANWPQKS
jgi:hypothetical protein